MCINAIALYSPAPSLLVAADQRAPGPPVRAMRPNPNPLTGFSEFSRLARFNLIGLVAAMASLCLHLWPDWSSDSNLSHGFLMPFICLYLLREARQNGTPRFVIAGQRNGMVFGVLLALALLFLAAAGLFAAAFGWSYSLVDLCLTLALSGLAGAALIAFSDERERAIGCNWIAFVAIALWLLCTPLPPGFAARLTLTLQLWISKTVVTTLHLLGIPAVRHGNIIELVNGTVGVEEACSGIRSLISCLFAGLFFSALLVRSRKVRAILILAAGPLALTMNLLRSMTLTLLSNGGVAIDGLWHDVTGYVVLAATSLLLVGLALKLEPKIPENVRTPPPTFNPPSPVRQRWLAVTLVAGCLMVTGFALGTRTRLQPQGAAPDLLAMIPSAPSGWQVQTTDLFQFSGILRTEHLAQRRYLRNDRDGPTEITVYVAYWQPGQASVSTVAAHTPDACWPGAGWTPVANAETSAQLSLPTRPLPGAEYRFFRAGQAGQHVWFWHVYDHQPINIHDSLSPRAVLATALRYGFRRAGPQMFIRVTSNRPWSRIQTETVLAEFFRATQPHGL